MQVKETVVADLMQGRAQQFQVPLYQRTYELRRRLNELDGVAIAEGKLALRPGFRLSLLESEENRERLFETLGWFQDRWNARG
ncbi:hypothetical protein [Kitasatospora sp. NPDC057223]|uniref:hypothetical protein n=1 Tax=Kitasatospora sp. NPDC057223 TaxID=3346055 RepID=UPI003633CCF3